MTERPAIVPKWIIGVAVSASVLGHLGLIAAVVLDETRSLPAIETQAIAVEVVTPEPEQANPPATPEQAKAETVKPPQPDFRLPELRPSMKDQKDEGSDQASAMATAPSVDKASSSTSQESPTAAASTANKPAQQPAGAAAAVSQPPPSPSAPSSPASASASQQAATVSPDLTVKYGIMFGLPDGDGGVSAYKKADVTPVDIATFKMHLRACAKLPGGVSPADHVKIVLRAFFAPNGRLMTEPALIEASASAKGPLLMRAAIAALESCQPFTMLPAARYDEWKVLDLSFTPNDFSS